MSCLKRLGWLAGGGAAETSGHARWCGLRSPQWGQWVKRCAVPRQTQWSGLQGRAVCGSRWRTQRGHAVAGGWWYVWTDCGVGGWGCMLVGVCAVPVVPVCAVPVLCLVDGV